MLRGEPLLDEMYASALGEAFGEVGTSGGHHFGVLFALSSRFSRRRAGIGPLVAAIAALADEDVHDRVVYLRAPGDRPHPATDS